MDIVGPRLENGRPNIVAPPVGAGRLTGIGTRQQKPKADAPANRDALRHARDVLADLNQCDPQG